MASNFLIVASFLLVIPFSFFLVAGSSYGFSGMVWTIYLMGRLRESIGHFRGMTPAPYF